MSSAYPVLDAATVARIAEHLVDVITLMHAEGLDEAQQQEVVRSVEGQLAAAERLHRFPLTNAAEPAFIMPKGPEGLG